MMDFVSPLILKTLQRTGGKNIIVLASGRGTMGKTWISIAMASILAKMGQKILLFDGDLGLANIDIQLGIFAQADITGILNGQVPMNKAIRCFEPGGFDIITGRSKTHSLQALDGCGLQLIKDDLSLLATHYDTVIVDLGSSSETMINVFSEDVGRILVVCTDELLALTQARNLLKMLSNKGKSDKIGIVINAVSSLKEGNRTYYTLTKACDDFLKGSLPLLGVIRQDSYVVDALENRLSVFNAYPDCKAISDVKKIIEKINDK
ncbi:MAG: AAA family ATPase [Alphaproteobacteria bacterium]|nr:AAA family ATPase [Alphaproteobacteria bacterium]